MKLKQKLAIQLIAGCLIGVLITVLPPAPQVLAQTLSERQAELTEQADAEKAKLDAANQQLDVVSEQMRALQEDLAAANADYNAVKDKIAATNAQIEAKERTLAENEAALQKNIGYLQKRVRNIYMYGQISYLDILFGAQDFSDFLMRMDLIKRILRYDYNLITAIMHERTAIIDTKTELETARANLEPLFTQAQATKDTLDTKQAALAQMVDKLTYDKETSERAYNELLAASNKIEQMLQNHSSSTVVGTGQMIWPLNGSVTSEYGWRTHPIYGTARYHSGMDIGGDYGMSIVAADSGTVSYAGWISGYGNTVIIDHGNGVSTLYGHNQSLNVSAGETVNQGDTIAQCGSTGNSTGPHCHFEVRVNGEPTSPYNYL